MNEFTGYPLFIDDDFAYAVHLSDSYAIEAFCRYFAFEQGTITFKSHDFVEKAYAMSVNCDNSSKNLQFCRNLKIVE